MNTTEIKSEAPPVQPPVDRIVSLRWSKEPPTKPGWYWNKDHHGVARIEQVHAHPELPNVMTMMENSWCGWRHVRIANKGREWAGPIPMPEAK